MECHPRSARPPEARAQLWGAPGHGGQRPPKCRRSLGVPDGEQRGPSFGSCPVALSISVREPDGARAREPRIRGSVSGERPPERQRAEPEPRTGSPAALAPTPNPPPGLAGVSSATQRGACAPNPRGGNRRPASAQGFYSLYVMRKVGARSGFLHVHPEQQGHHARRHLPGLQPGG